MEEDSFLDEGEEGEKCASICVPTEIIGGLQVTPSAHILTVFPSQTSWEHYFLKS